MPICTYCEQLITETQIQKREAQRLLGVWSHKGCDEQAWENIDKHIKKGKNIDPGEI